MKPKITFITNDGEKEANYICFLSKNISRNNYQEGGFYVLPHPVKHEKSIYLPDLNYSPRFWKAINNTKTVDYALDYPKQAVNEVVSTFTPSINTISKSELNKFQKLMNEFLDLCENYFGTSTQFPKVKSIEILFTEFGTIGSYHIFRSKNSIDIKLTSRTDLPINQISRTLLHAFYTIVSGRKTEIGEKYWYEREAVVNYLLNYSELSKFKLKPIENNFNLLDLRTESDTYLVKLGFPRISLINEEYGKLQVAGTNLEAVLTKQEYECFKYLYQNTGRMVSFDTVADVLWKENSDEKYSLYAIAKVIENIRKKMRLLGINKDVILTIRSKGYLFEN